MGFTKEEKAARRKQLTDEILKVVWDEWDKRSDIVLLQDRFMAAATAGDLYVQKRVNERPQDKSFIMSVAIEIRDNMSAHLEAEAMRRRAERQNGGQKQG